MTSTNNFGKKSALRKPSMLHDPLNVINLAYDHDTIKENTKRLNVGADLSLTKY